MQCLMIWCLLVLVVVTSANPPVLPIATIEQIPNPNYGFNYAVNDPTTGDNKGQWEVRNGDVVQGAYSLVEPDGTLRIVEYTASDLTGFNAVVRRIGPALHPISVPRVALRPLVTTPIINQLRVPLGSIGPGPILHPSSILKPIGPILAPIPTPIRPLSTSVLGALGPLGLSSPWGQPIVVSDNILPVRSLNPLTLGPLGRPSQETEPEDEPAPGPPGVRISGATYGKNGLIRNWSAGPISLDGRSLIIRHKH